MSLKEGASDWIDPGVIPSWLGLLTSPRVHGETQLVLWDFLAPVVGSLALVLSYVLREIDELPSCTAEFCDCVRSEIVHAFYGNFHNSSRSR